MYSETLTLIVSSTCLKTSDPVGGAWSETNEGPMHSLSLTAVSALLPFCLNLGWTLSSDEEDDDRVVSVDLLSSCHSKLVSLKKKYQNISYFAKTKFSSAKNTKLAQFQNVP